MINAQNDKKIIAIEGTTWMSHHKADTKAAATFYVQSVRWNSDLKTMVGRISPDSHDRRGRLEMTKRDRKGPSPARSQEIRESDVRAPARAGISI